jgi:hypothetical protein
MFLLPRNYKKVSSKFNLLTISKRYNMTNRLLTLVLFLVSSTVAFSQSTGKIAGVATDEVTGDQLPGVNVSVVGTTLGASTDVDVFT